MAPLPGTIPMFMAAHHAAASEDSGDGGGGGEPEWPPENAIAGADFEHGLYYAGAAAKMAVAVLDTPEAVVEDQGIVFTTGDMPGIQFIGDMLTDFLAGSGTIVVDLTPSGEINGEPWPGSATIIICQDEDDFEERYNFQLGISSYLAAYDAETSGEVDPTGWTKTIGTRTKIAFSYSDTKLSVSKDGEAAQTTTFTALNTTPIRVLLGDSFPGGNRNGGPFTLHSVVKYALVADEDLPALSALS